MVHSRIHVTGSARSGSWVCAFLLATVAPTLSAAPYVDLRAQAPAAAYGSLPPSFEANEGQVDPAVRFLSHGHGYDLFLTPTETIWSLRGPARGTAVVRLRPSRVNGQPRLAGEGPLAARTSYLLGGDPGRWRTGIANYSQVRAASVYPGVDMLYRSSQRGQIEVDFIVAPGADPGRIRLVYRGADSISMGPEGDLTLHTPSGDLVQHAPVLYQEHGKQRERVAGRYVFLGEGAGRELGFRIGSYDPAWPLVIDPVLVYSTFLGGGAIDGGTAIALDEAGNAYVTGTTSSMTFPGVGGSSIQPGNAGSFDAFVTKINAAGTAIVYSTFLGGTEDDFGNSVAVDAAGNAYVAGETRSPSFPGVALGSIQPAANGGTSDAFVTKLNAAGTGIVYSTFLGGSGLDSASGIAVDASGNAYVTGITSSTTFPGVTASSIQAANGGLTDAFVTKINGAGTAIVWSTFLGGNDYDHGAGIALDRAGNVYITGGTYSSSFPGASASPIQPANAGFSDAFVTKIDAAGTAILYSTFLGGGGYDTGYQIAVDFGGSAYITGVTMSATFAGVSGSSIQPVSGGGNDGFVTKLTPAGTAIVYSTFLGSIGDDYGFGIAVDRSGNAYVTGITSSTSFPGVTPGSLQPANGGFYDAFVTEIDAAGAAIVYSTFLGGSQNDSGQGIAVDAEGNAYVTGGTASPTFPGVTSASIQPVPGSFGFDAFVTKIGPAAAIPTLSSWGWLAMALLLAAMGLMTPSLRRRRPR